MLNEIITNYESFSHMLGFTPLGLSVTIIGVIIGVAIVTSKAFKSEVLGMKTEDNHTQCKGGKPSNESTINKIRHRLNNMD